MEVERGNGKVELGMYLALVSMVLLLRETLDGRLLEMVENCFRLDVVESGIISSGFSFEEVALYLMNFFLMLISTEKGVSTILKSRPVVFKSLKLDH